MTELHKNIRVLALKHILILSRTETETENCKHSRSHIICTKTYNYIYMKLLLPKKELFCCHQKNNEKDIGQAERVHFQRMLKKIVVSNFLKLPTKTKTLNAFTTFGKCLWAKRCFVFFLRSYIMS